MTELITMMCCNNNKVIIDMNELRNSNLLQGANIFNKLFNFENVEWAETKEMNKDNNGNHTLFKDFGIEKRYWMDFIGFMRNGQIKYQLSQEFINDEKSRNEYQRLFIQKLDNMLNEGIFLAFGPFPKFEAFVAEQIMNQTNIKLNRLNELVNNPMTPKQDRNKLYDWCISHVRIDSSWSVTIPIPETPQFYYWRRKKQD
jgi:hypothetical protein